MSFNARGQTKKGRNKLLSGAGGGLELLLVSLNHKSSQILLPCHKVRPVRKYTYLKTIPLYKRKTIARLLKLNDTKKKKRTKACNNKWFESSNLLLFSAKKRPLLLPLMHAYGWCTRDEPTGFSSCK